MDRKAEIILEKAICAKVVDCLLAAGYGVGVNDGEETTVVNSTDRAVIIEATFSTDEDYILAYTNGHKVGWVFLVWGNYTDLISDYTTNLEEALKPVNEFVRQLDDGSPAAYAEAFAQPRNAVSGTDGGDA
jgi:hypothetical protein